MFRWLLVLAMALLPWHGWAGTSPAVAPAATAAAQPAVVAATMHEVHHGVDGADCLEHAGSTDHHAAADADDGCPGCSMCHSCSPVALPAMTGVPSPEAVPPRHQSGEQAQFASADRDPGLKPPIS